LSTRAAEQLDGQLFVFVLIGEDLGAVGQLLLAYKPLLQGQFFQGCQPALVIGAGITRFFRPRDVFDEDSVELVPLVASRVGEGDGHAEGAPLPGVFKTNSPLLRGNAEVPVMLVTSLSILRSGVCSGS